MAEGDEAAAGWRALTTAAMGRIETTRLAGPFWWLTTVHTLRDSLTTDAKLVCEWLTGQKLRDRVFQGLR